MQINCGLDYNNVIKVTSGIISNKNNAMTDKSVGFEITQT